MRAGCVNLLLSLWVTAQGDGVCSARASAATGAAGVCVCAQFQLLHDIMQPCVCLFLFMAVFSESVQAMHRGIYSVCFMVLQWEL